MRYVKLAASSLVLGLWLSIMWAVTHPPIGYEDYWLLFTGRRADYYLPLCKSPIDPYDRECRVRKEVNRELARRTLGVAIVAFVGGLVIIRARRIPPTPPRPFLD
jgi:hypothetical protein